MIRIKASEIQSHIFEFDISVVTKDTDRSNPPLTTSSWLEFADLVLILEVAKPWILFLE